ncbi:HAD-like protein [Atractiella rhizophila]|nr:HAD-like protein [Atractiella rhizophila]
MSTLHLTRIALRRTVFPSTLPRPRPLPRFLSVPPSPASPSQPPQHPPTPKPHDESTTAPVEAAPSLASQYLDMTEAPPPPPEQERRRGRGGKRSMSSIDKKKRNAARWSTGIFAFGAAVWLWWAGREWETAREKEEHKDDVYSNRVEARYRRSMARISDALDYFNKPAYEPLLPSLEGVPIEYTRPYTLLIELDGVLTGTKWTREHGWRTAKRPGVEEFLNYLSQFYEIVVFTTMPHFVAEPITHQLDKFNRYIMFAIYRDGTRQVGPTLVKDLSYLGRDLSKVILIDSNPDVLKLQPHNGLILPKWSPGDRTHDGDLVRLIPFLDALAILGVEDVRTVIKDYEGKDVATEWEKVEERMRERAREIYGRKTGSEGSKSGWDFAGMLGLRPVVKKEEPKSFLDIQRERAKEMYKLNNEEFEKQRPLAEKQQEEWVKMQAEQSKSSLWGFLSGQAYKDQIELQQKMMEEQRKAMEAQQAQQAQR